MDTCAAVTIIEPCQAITQGINPKETIMTHAYTIMGYTVQTAEQARTIFLVAKLSGNDAAAKQAMALIPRLP